MPEDEEVVHALEARIVDLRRRRMANKGVRLSIGSSQAGLPQTQVQAAALAMNLLRKSVWQVRKVL